jgi:predicted RNA-binding protein
MKKHLINSGLIIALISTISCSNDTETKTEEQILSESNKTPKVQINRAVFDEMIQSLPQPIEIANIITKAKMPFSKEMLVPSENSDKYSDKYFQSMAFGAYGVDLGYINLNDKKIYVIQYLEAIKNLSEALKVQQFFDFQTLYELNSNRNNPDSLIHISTKNFNKIDEFLREENRGELSVLMLIGAWTEGMYMFGKLYTKDQNEDLLNRIGEQKVVFQNITLILNKLSEIEHFKKLKEDVSPINKLYENVKISYVYHEPETKEVNGELVIIDKTETKIEITKEDATKIISAIETLRKKYLLIN